MDVVVASAGLLLLLEVTRRALGAPMAVLGIVFVMYAFLGPWLPDALAHRGASIERLMSHMWLTTEGVYGVALGVSVRSEEHTSELQSLMRSSYAVFCLKKKKKHYSTAIK